MSARLDEWKTELRRMSPGRLDNATLQPQVESFDSAFAQAELIASFGRFTDEAVLDLVHHNAEGKTLRLALDALPRLQEAYQLLVPTFEARWQRCSKADHVLTVLREAPPPLPGSDDWRVVAARTHEAEAIRAQMTTEGAAIFARLEKRTEVFVSEVRRGIARVCTVALNRYARVEQARLNELLSTVRRNAAATLESINIYEAFVADAQSNAGRPLDVPTFTLPRNALAELAASPDPRRLEERPAERAATPGSTNAGRRRGFAGLLSGTR